jgi:hypothetical protein
MSHQKDQENVIECPRCQYLIPTWPLDDERLEGLDAVRKFLDPTMSRTYFYKHHRHRLDYMLMEYRYWYRRKDNVRFWTWKRLMMAYVIKQRVL